MERLAALCRGRFALPDAHTQGSGFRFGDAHAGVAGAAAPLHSAPASNGAAASRRAEAGGGAAAGHILAAPAATWGAAYRQDEPGTFVGDLTGAADRASGGPAAPRAGSPTRARVHPERLQPAAEAYDSFAAATGPPGQAPGGGPGADAGGAAPRPGGSGASHAQPPTAPTLDDDPLGAGAMFGSPARPAGRAEADVGVTDVLPLSGAADPLPGEAPRPPPATQPAASLAAGSEALNGDGAAEPAPDGSAPAAERPWDLRHAQACSSAGDLAQAPANSTAGEAGCWDGHAAAFRGHGGVAEAGGTSGPGEASCRFHSGGDGEHKPSGALALLRAESNASELNYAAADPAQPRRGLRRFRPSVTAGDPAPNPDTDPHAGGQADLFGPTPGSFRIRSADGEGPPVFGDAATPASAPAALAAGRRRLFSEPSVAVAARSGWDAAGESRAERASEAGGAAAGGGRLEGLPRDLPGDVPPRGPVGRRLTDIFAGLEAGRGLVSDPPLSSAGGSAAWSDAGGGGLMEHVPEGPDQASPADGAPALASATGVQAGDSSMARQPDQAPGELREALETSKDPCPVNTAGRAIGQGPGLQRAGVAVSGPERGPERDGVEGAGGERV